MTATGRSSEGFVVAGVGRSVLELYDCMNDTFFDHSGAQISMNSGVAGK